MIRGSGAIVIGLAVSLLSAEAFGEELYPVGSESKAKGMASSLASRRGSAVLYNPSNLTLTKSRRTYVEAGFLSVNYAYEHPEYDPVVVKTNTPVAAIGYGGQLIKDLSLGVVFLPTKMGEMDIPGLPKDVGGDVTPVNVETSDTAFIAGLGLGYRVNRYYRIGVSAVYRQENMSLKANVVGNPNTVLNYDLVHRSLTPTIGQRFSYANAATSLTYTPALKKNYEGSYNAASSDNPERISLTNYEAAKIGLGLSYAVANFTFEVEASQERWGDGRAVIKGPTYTEGAEADLNNVWNRGVSVNFDTKRRLTMTAGYSVLPTPWGAGNAVEGDESNQYGVEFGQLNGMDKKVIGLGAQAALSKDTRLDASFYHANGKREVVGGSNAGEGRYQLALTAITGTLSTKF